jgi:chaperonin GroES
MARAIEPMGDRVLVRVMKQEELSAGGVVLPDAVRERSQRGLVLSVGPGRWHDGQVYPVLLDPGDVVVFSKYGGTELPDGGENLLMLREADILGRETGDEPVSDEAAGAEAGS